MGSFKENVVVHFEKVIVIFKGGNKRQAGTLPRLQARTFRQSGDPLWIVAQTIVNKSFLDHEKALARSLNVCGRASTLILLQ